MDALQAAVLGLIQGLTEFLPISSSGHLVLAPIFFGWQDQSLAFDVAVHFGTLLAVMGYFWRELRELVPAGFRPLLGQGMDPQARMAWGLLLSTVPASVVGLVMRAVLEVEINNPLVVAANLIVFGLLLWWADTRMRGSRSEEYISWREFFLLGCAQALALSPGTSRSGITMTAAMMLGMSRVAAARVSFLMAIPVIAMAAAYEFMELLTSEGPVAWDDIGIGVAAAFVSGLVCIHWLLRLLQTTSFLPFVIYRVALGGLILVLFW